MLEQLFPKHHGRYETLEHADELRSFGSWLLSTGYSHELAHDHVRRLHQVLDHADVPLGSQVARARVSELFAVKPQNKLFLATQRAFSRCLVAQKRLLPQADLRPHAAVLIAYEDQLTHVRGLHASTVGRHVATVEVFLSEALPPGASIENLSWDGIERHVVETGQRISRQSTCNWIGRLRSFLRFCHAQGLLLQPLDAIDTPRVYRDELPPRALPWATVLQLLRSIDRRGPLGWRDYTILHLMSYYGLRPCEVVSLKLDAIDWQARTLHVEQHKTCSTLMLPLTDQTLQILQNYLREGRPDSQRPELFLRARGPSGPMQSHGVCDRYKVLAARSGLPLQGTSAYSLRHSFAMRLLERGVGIKAIGDVLGHHGLESTCVYLRLQLDVLRDVALPLPHAVAPKL